MKSIQEIIASGILEMYVLGAVTEAERAAIVELAADSKHIKEEISRIETALESYAKTNAVTPPATVKPFLFAQIDYRERLKAGEPIVKAPLLSELTTVSDFAPWLSRKDMVFPADKPAVFAKILSAQNNTTTAMAWLVYGSPPEEHKDKYERFFILEGACQIIYEDRIVELNVGDYHSVPPLVAHELRVISNVPCKCIIQYVAA